MLTPLILTDEELLESTDVFLPEILPTKTYKIDFETGEIYAELIDNEEAIKQFIVKAIKTIRDKYLIYTTNIGSEIHYLMGKTYSQEYLELEVPRLVNEALMVDDRINKAYQFKISRTDDELYINFKVETNTGDVIEMEVTV